MSEFKGTKGKWNYDDGDNSSIDMVLDDNSTISVSRHDRYGDGLVGSREEMQANALLISKAPEMLEKLKEILFIVDWSYEAWTSNDGLNIKEEIEQLIKEATEL